MESYLIMPCVKNNQDPTPGSLMLGLSMGPRLHPSRTSDLRLSGTLSGLNAGGGARAHDRMVTANVRVDYLSTVPPTFLSNETVNGRLD
ncbi:hypothetical protein PoB_005057400 [Plakobranchus ocellatus]|uniref:Uncharacterized protein n=1 Tax=Plakobranchus ocellatus TaxID=259542 RepID=A0AAV4BZ01_9GAST|nr:hypothetical protein PoB_005057400 [Plakobranchus ocellatus]